MSSAKMTKSAPVLILGKNGLISSHLGKSLSEEGWLVKYGTRQPSEQETDFTFCLDQPVPEYFDALSPGVVIFLAAESSPDFCKNHPEEAWRRNVTNTSIYIRYFLQKGWRIIFASSDTVFGETNAPSYEDAPRLGVEPYAKMKIAIEEEFCKERNFISLRFSYVVTGDDAFSKLLHACVADKKVLEAFDNFYRNAVAFDDIKKLILILLQKDNFKEYHAVNLSGPECLSRYEMALRLNPNAKSLLKPFSAPDSFFLSRPRMINSQSEIFESLVGEPNQFIGKVVDD